MFSDLSRGGGIEERWGVCRESEDEDDTLTLRRFTEVDASCAICLSVVFARKTFKNGSYRSIDWLVLLFVCSEEVSGAGEDQTALEDLVRIFYPITSETHLNN